MAHLARKTGRPVRVRLSREELDKIACWIDLLVPFCGDYTEAGAWTDEERAKFRRYADKRARMEEIERRNFVEWSEAKTTERTAR